MSEVEMRHDLNHWIVRVRRVFDPAGSWAGGPLVHLLSSKKAKLMFWLACWGSYPSEFWTHPRCQFLGFPVLDYCHGENCFLILQCLLLQCACPCALLLWSLSPSALHPVLGGEGSKKVPSDSPPLEQTHLPQTLLLHHVFQPQGMLECPSDIDLSELDAGNSEDALAQASAWVAAQALTIVCPGWALSSISTALYLLLPGLAD